MSEPFVAPSSSPGSPAGPGELRRDLEAALAARRELGPEYEEHLAAGLADRVEQLVAYRTAELQRQAQAGEVEAAAEKSRRTQRFVLGIISLGAGIPITAISGSLVEPGLLGIIVSWAGIVGVNVAASLNDRKRSGR